MFLNELYYYDRDGFGQDKRYDPEDDEASTRKGTNTRKTRLTLRQINKLRRMIEVRKYEKLKDLEIVRQQYATPTEDGGGM